MLTNMLCHYSITNKSLVSSQKNVNHEVFVHVTMTCYTIVKNFVYEVYTAVYI